MTEPPNPVDALIAARLGLAVPPSQSDRLAAARRAAAQSLSLETDAAVADALAALPLQSTPWQEAIARLTVGETCFLRQRSWFEQVERQVLAPLIAERRRLGELHLTLWSAGCSSGEEAYTLALLLDRLIPDRDEWQIRLVATDIDERRLATARQGRYRPWTLRELMTAERERHFAPDEGGYHVARQVRERVEFRFHNLAEQGLPVTDVDVLFCRNVLMYLTPTARQAAAARLRQALAPGGWLIVSPAEAPADWHRPLRPVNFPEAIFFRDLPSPPVETRPPYEPIAVSLIPAAPHRHKPAPTQIRAPEKALDQARRLADRGHLDEARRLCETAIRVDRLDGEAQLLLSAVCEEMGERTAAFAAARRAAYLAPDSALAHFRLGSLLSALGRPGQARRSMETVLQLLGRIPAGTAEGEVSAGVLREAAAAYLSDTHG
jgi:chemotaxis protein methyltransferase CheR